MLTLVKNKDIVCDECKKLDKSCDIFMIGKRQTFLVPPFEVSHNGKRYTHNRDCSATYYQCIDNHLWIRYIRNITPCDFVGCDHQREYYNTPTKCTKIERVNCDE